MCLFTTSSSDGDGPVNQKSQSLISVLPTPGLGSAFTAFLFGAALQCQRAVHVSDISLPELLSVTGGLAVLSFLVWLFRPAFTYAGSLVFWAILLTVILFDATMLLLHRYGQQGPSTWYIVPILIGLGICVGAMKIALRIARIELGE